MKLDIRDFNLKLENFTKEAKLLEKQDPSRAKRMWLKICEFVLEFSKQPGLERSLKLKLWSHTDAIIKKLKIESSSTDSSSERISSFSTSEESKFDFDSLPKVPTDDKFDEKDASGLTDDTSIKISEDDAFSVDNVFYSKILDLEKELKTMPSSFKEITPKPYSPEKSIILSQKKDDSQSQINVQLNNKSILGKDIDAIDSDTIDVYRGTKDFDGIEDPFVPKPDSEIKGDANHLCFACGSQVKKKEKTCPKCGAEL